VIDNGLAWSSLAGSRFRTPHIGRELLPGFGCSPAHTDDTVSTQMQIQRRTSQSGVSEGILISTCQALRQPLQGICAAAEAGNVW